jgi:hypothetical protein
MGISVLSPAYTFTALITERNRRAKERPAADCSTLQLVRFRAVVVGAACAAACSSFGSSPSSPTPDTKDASADASPAEDDDAGDAIDAPAVEAGAPTACASVLTDDFERSDPVDPRWDDHYRDPDATLVISPNHASGASGLGAAGGGSSESAFLTRILPTAAAGAPILCTTFRIMFPAGVTGTFNGPRVVAFAASGSASEGQIAGLRVEKGDLIFQQVAKGSCKAVAPLGCKDASTDLGPVIADHWYAVTISLEPTEAPAPDGTFGVAHVAIDGESSDIRLYVTLAGQDSRYFRFGIVGAPAGQKLFLDDVTIAP